MIYRIFFATFLTLGLLMSGGQGFAQEKKGSKIYYISPAKIARYVEITKGQKRILFVYASYCLKCRDLMPALIDMEGAKPGSVIAVSVDHQHIDFAKYMKELGRIPFRMILTKGTPQKLVEVLAPLGVTPWQAYPHIVFMDETNKVVNQGGVFTAQQMAEFLFAPPPPPGQNPPQ